MFAEWISVHYMYMCLMFVHSQNAKCQLGQTFAIGCLHPQFSYRNWLILIYAVHLFARVWTQACNTNINNQKSAYILRIRLCLIKCDLVSVVWWRYKMCTLIACIITYECVRLVGPSGWTSILSLTMYLYMKRFFDEDINVNCKSRWNVCRRWFDRNSGGC